MDGFDKPAFKLSAPKAPVKASAKPSGGLGGFVKRNLPLIGGVAGTIAAAPFTGGTSLFGTAALLGAGGAAGAGLGEFGKEKATGQKVNPAEITRQAVESGVTSAIPIGGVAKGARLLKGTAPAVDKSVFRPTTFSNLLSKASESGQRMESRSAGIGLGEKISGKQAVSPQIQKQLLNTLKSEGIPSGHPEIQARAIAAKLDSYHNLLDTTLKNANIRLPVSNVKQIASDYLKKVESSPTVDNNVRKYAQQFADNLTKQAKSVSGLHTFRRGIDKNAISYIANPDAATSAKTEAARLMRSHLSDTIGKIAPEVKTVNSRYSKLLNAKDYSLNQASRLTRQSENAGGGLIGRLLTGDVAQTVKSKTGAAMQNVEKIPSNTLLGRITSNVGRETTKQAIGRDVVGSQLSPSQTETPPSLESDLQNIDTTGAESLPGFQGEQQTSASTDQGLFNQDNIQRAIIADIATTGGKNIGNLTNLYKVFGQASQPGANISKVTSQQYGLAQQGIQSLQALEGLIGQNPSAVTKSSAPGQGLPIIGGYIQKAYGTNDYKALSNNVIDTLLRLRTGAQANKEEVALYSRSFVPQAGDSPQTVQRKLAQLRQGFQDVLDMANTKPSSSLDLSTAGVQ